MRMRMVPAHLLVTAEDASICGDAARHVERRWTLHCPCVASSTLKPGWLIRRSAGEFNCVSNGPL